MNLDDTTTNIIEKVRRRRAQLQEDCKENVDVDNRMSDELVTTAQCGSVETNKDVDESARPSQTIPDVVKETDVDADVMNGAVQPAARRSAFAALAQDYHDFEVMSPLKEKPKEAYMKGRSPRLSIGETRPAILCTPAGISQLRSPPKSSLQNNTSSPQKNNESPQKNNQSPQKCSLVPSTTPSGEDARRIRFAHPIAAASLYEELYSSTSEISNRDASNTSVKITRCQNIIEESDQGNVSSEEYGAHTFLRKKEKTPTKSESSSSLKICSPKPFVRGGSASHFSPIHFNPTSTSSPKVVEGMPTITSKPNCVLTTPKNDFLDDLETHARAASKVFPKTTIAKNDVVPLSPVRAAAIDHAKTKTIARQWEEKLKSAGDVHMQSPVVAAPKSSQNQVTPTAVKTLWRGSHGTPVVVGTDVSAPKTEKLQSSTVKSLKSRWEFSSITGTPLHPDESEDSLVRAAIRMRETALPKKENQRSGDVKKPTTPVNERKTYASNASMCSPAAKSPRYEKKLHYETMVVSDSPPTSKHEAESSERSLIDADSFADNEDSDDMDQTENVSRFINEAFDFMGTSPVPSFANKSPGSCLNEASSPVKQVAGKEVQSSPSPVKHVVEEEEIEEDVPVKEATVQEVHTPELKSDRAGQFPHSISFYRKRGRSKTADPSCEMINLTPSAPSQHVIGGTAPAQDEEDFEALKANLDMEIKVQQSRISQASRALQHCRSQEEFRGSREEVDAQRALLVSSQTRLAMISELERLKSGDRRNMHGPRGAITISSIVVPIKKEFVNSHSRSNDVFYFLALVKAGSDVQCSMIVTSDEAQTKGAVEFAHYFNLKNLFPSFLCNIEIYALRTSRELYSHEEKYRLKGTTGKNKTLSRQSVHQLANKGHLPSVSDSSFHLVGVVSLDISTPSGRKTFVLQNSMYPLDGSVVIKMKKFAQDRIDTHHRGFLSMYQRTKDGLGSWNRYWCVLDGGEMKFWRSPDDECNQDKSWLVLLDLQTCSGNAQTVKETCPYPNSFHIDVWVQKEGGNHTNSGRPELQKLRVNLAADTKSDMQLWLDQINSTVEHILMWSRTVSNS